MSKTGVVFCSIYLLTTILCFATIFLFSIDFKSQFVLLQLPIAFQISIIHEMGLLPLIQNISSTIVYIFLWTSTFNFLYFFGKFLDS